MALRLPSSRSTAWVLAESAASALFSLGSLLLIGRVIGPVEAGIGAVVTAAFLLLDVIGASLFPDSLVQRRRLAGNHVRSALTASVLVGAGAGLVLAGAAPLLSMGTGTAAMLPLALALAPLLPLSAFSGAASGLATRNQRFRLLSMRVLVGQPLALVAGLLAAAGGLGAWAMVINQAVATIFTFLLFLVVGRLPLRPELNRRALGELWPVAGPQIAALVLMVGRYRIFLLALGLIVTQAVLAHAHFAFRMLDAALVMVWQAVARIAMPRLCSLQHDREALTRCYGQIVQVQALLGLPLALGVALVSMDLVAALLGPDWAGTAEAARIAGIAGVLSLLHGNHVSLFVALGMAKRNMQEAVANLAVPLIALAAFQPQTATGVAIAWASQAIIVTPVLIGLVLRELHRSPLWLLRQAAPAIFAAVAMVIVVLLVQGAMAEAQPLTRLLAAVASGAVVYVVVAWLALGAKRPAALETWRGSTAFVE